MNRCSVLDTSPAMQNARGLWGAGGAGCSRKAWCLELALGMRLTALRNVPKLEETINTALSDCTT